LRKKAAERFVEAVEGRRNRKILTRAKPTDRRTTSIVQGRREGGVKNQRLTEKHGDALEEEIKKLPS